MLSWKIQPIDPAISEAPADDGTGTIGLHCNWGKIDIPNGGVPDEA